MKFLLWSLRILLLAGMMTAVFYASIFWIGAPGRLEERLAEGYWSFFFARLLFCVIAAIPFFLADMLLLLAFRKTMPFRWKKVVVSFVACVLVALLITSIVWLPKL